MSKLQAKADLHAQYEAHRKESRAKWQYAMTYEQWLANALIDTQQENARLKEKIAAVDSIVWGVRTLVEYPADEGIRDIGDILGGK